MAAMRTLAAIVNCWGRNDNDGHSKQQCLRCSGRTASSGTYVQVSVGRSHACALTTTNAVDCWGANDYDELGCGVGPTFPSTCGPRKPASGSYIHVSVGGYHTCAVTTEGTVDCWGYNNVASTATEYGGLWVVVGSNDGEENTPRSLAVATLDTSTACDLVGCAEGTQLAVAVCHDAVRPVDLSIDGGRLHVDYLHE